MIDQKFVDSFFPNIIGQTKVKRQLAFYIQSFRSTGLLPHLLMLGGKGGGKTAISQMVARNLVVKELGTPKPMVKINCATVRKLPNLVEHVLMPYVIKDHVTAFFDEAHCLEPQAQDALLTALNPDKHNKGYINYKDSVLEFDYKKVSFIFATTDPQLLSNPLKDRLRTIQLQDYSTDELGEIVRLNLTAGNTIEDDALLEAAKTCRGNARGATMMAKDNINQYCGASGITNFSKEDWDKMGELLSINPLGLGEAEVQTLEALKGSTGRSLTSLSAATGLEKSALQHQYEPYLLRHNLVEIGQGGRRLTKKGLKYLEELDELNKTR